MGSDGDMGGTYLSVSEGMVSMSAYVWEAEVTIRDKETKEVVGILEGWQLADTTFYGIEEDVVDYVRDMQEEVQDE